MLLLMHSGGTRPKNNQQIACRMMIETRAKTLFLNGNVYMDYYTWLAKQNLVFLYAAKVTNLVHS